MSIPKSILITFTSLVILFCSCNNPTIIGEWKGTYTSLSAASAGNLYYSYVVSPDSTIQVQGIGADGNTYKSVGTWSLSGTTFYCTIKNITGGQNGVIQKEKATWNASERTLTNGVWTDIYDSGTFNQIT